MPSCSGRPTRAAEMADYRPRLPVIESMASYIVHRLPPRDAPSPGAAAHYAAVRQPRVHDPSQAGVNALGFRIANDWTRLPTPHPRVAGRSEPRTAIEHLRPTSVRALDRPRTTRVRGLRVRGLPRTRRCPPNGRSHAADPREVRAPDRPTIRMAVSASAVPRLNAQSDQQLDDRRRVGANLSRHAGFCGANRRTGVSLYITTSIAQPAAGKVAELLGPRRVFTSGTAS